MSEPATEQATEASIAHWGALAAVSDAQALRALEAAAQRGVVRAQQVLGSTLLQRQDAASLTQGRDWLERAARAGDAKAQLALGRWWFKGAAGAGMDARQAGDWLRAALAGGLPQAAYYLALMARNGSGEPAPDADKAARLMAVAARAGLPDAQFFYGQMLLLGEGLAADPMAARTWFEKAAEQEQPEAALQLWMASTRGEMGFAADAQAQARQYAEAQHALRHRPLPP